MAYCERRALENCRTTLVERLHPTTQFLGWFVQHGVMKGRDFNKITDISTMSQRTENFLFQVIARKPGALKFLIHKLKADKRTADLAKKLKDEVEQVEFIRRQKVEQRKHRKILKLQQELSNLYLFAFGEYFVNDNSIDFHLQKFKELQHTFGHAKSFPEMVKIILAKNAEFVMWMRELEAVQTAMVDLKSDYKRRTCVIREQLKKYEQKNKDLEVENETLRQNVQSMDTSELYALETCRKDISNNLLVTDAVLRRLESTDMISHRDRMCFMRIRQSSKRNTQLAEIMRKKEKGFSAFTEALMLERNINQYCVDKMQKMVKHHKQQHRLRELKETDLVTDGKPFRDTKKCPKPSVVFESFYNSVAPLVHGDNKENCMENTEKQSCDGSDIVKALKHCRMALDPKEENSDVSLKDLQSKYLQKKLQTIADDLRSERSMWKKRMESLLVENDELTTKVEELESELQQERDEKDKIIRETVDRIVKERLLRLNHVDTKTSSKPSVTINIHNHGHFQMGGTNAMDLDSDSTSESDQSEKPDYENQNTPDFPGLADSVLY
ncbi:uncharacterized protein LOC134239161 [Saccostrea cucullata]|uniref:uncharacterized protein LOC134239161 n=1 Tax=Saccostrea cuccullata TaxID=36930 RepID=UPI002ED000B8